MTFGDHIYNWLKQPDAIAQLHGYLKRLDLSNFNFKVSMNTQLRAHMVSSSNSEGDEQFKQFLESLPEPKLFIFQDVRTFIDKHSSLSECSDFISSTVSNKEINKLLKKHARIVNNKDKYYLPDLGNSYVIWTSQVSRKYSINEIKRWINNRGEEIQSSIDDLLE